MPQAFHELDFIKIHQIDRLFLHDTCLFFAPQSQTQGSHALRNHDT
jgi:hypothetical protein